MKNTQNVKMGDKFLYTEANYPATVTKVVDNELVEIRLSSGSACVDVGDLKPLT